MKYWIVTEHGDKVEWWDTYDEAKEKLDTCELYEENEQGEKVKIECHIEEDNSFKGSVKSNKGFYLGDTSYTGGAIPYAIHKSRWGKDYFDAGIYEVNGYSVAEGLTKWGDGDYFDLQGNLYCVDSGIIGLVPLELIDLSSCSAEELGMIFEMPGEATIDYDDGFYIVTLPNGERHIIDTTVE